MLCKIDGSSGSFPEFLYVCDLFAGISDANLYRRNVEPLICRSVVHQALRPLRVLIWKKHTKLVG